MTLAWALEVSGGNMIKFYVKGFYVMGEALSGELSCMLTGLNSSSCQLISG